jgi:hypothetical protein
VVALVVLTLLSFVVPYSSGYGPCLFRSVESRKLGGVGCGLGVKLSSGAR